MGMNIFGVGPFEFFVFLLIALLILGPERMISASRGIARFIRNLILSPTWRTVQQVQVEMRNFPTQLIREAGLDDINKIVPTPEEIAKEAGLDDLARQVDEVKKQVQGDITAANTQINHLTQQASQPAAKTTTAAASSPASPLNSGVPTISAPPPAPPSPSGPPTIQKS
jgi:Sec-independent protein translocase protein TatA